MRRMRRDRQPTHLSPLAKEELAAYMRAYRRKQVPPQLSDETRAEMTELARLRRSRG